MDLCGLTRARRDPLPKGRYPQSRPDPWKPLLLANRWPKVATIRTFKPEFPLFRTRSGKSHRLTRCPRACEHSERFFFSPEPRRNALRARTGRQNRGISPPGAGVVVLAPRCELGVSCPANGFKSVKNARECTGRTGQRFYLFWYHIPPPTLRIPPTFEAAIFFKTNI